MTNLAGNRDCDKTIREELIQANMPIIELGAPMNREVPASVIGMVNGFRFIRAWYYWMVFGDMPLEYAKDIYLKYKDLGIRCAGHCGNPPPEEWCESKDFHEKCKPIIDRFMNKELSSEDADALCNEIRRSGDQFIKTYHVDTQEGLNKLAETIIGNNISADKFN